MPMSESQRGAFGRYTCSWLFPCPGWVKRAVSAALRAAPPVTKSRDYAVYSFLRRMGRPGRYFNVVSPVRAVFNVSKATCACRSDLSFGKLEGTPKRRTGRRTTKYYEFIPEKRSTFLF